ncbi:helix-turn-helix domain-containing protein [Caenimonas sp. SL110]|uniref:helix-turn-helix domain-containing protein n=1 Tax=Caenimonas sp. SL110 TaxID=1450524 RepID=UPI0009E27CE3|nr:helix-turn-helix domain-containing protein [Caenimonas sp. SL110]
MKIPKLIQIQSSAELSGLVRTTRVALGLTQAEVGTLVGVKQSRMAQIENFPGLVSCEQMLQVLHALGIRLYLSQPLPNAGTHGAPGAPLTTAQDLPDSQW